MLKINFSEWTDSNFLPAAGGETRNPYPDGAMGREGANKRNKRNRIGKGARERLIDQITHAYAQDEPYAVLFAETLRKPLQATMRQEWERINSLVRQMRQLTNDYTIPENACVTHKVTFLKLQELDNDITQHLYLENAILLPRAIKIEKELLA